MLYVLCGELDKTSVSKENVDRLKAVFDSAESSLYVDNICAGGNENSKTESLSALWGLVSLAKKANVDLQGLALARSENGKPYFKNSPWQFSISHTGDLRSGSFACALSDGRVGIDIEAKMTTDEKAIKLAERFFSARELEFVKKAPRENFTKVWTAKEACTKILGVTLSEGLKRADIFSDEFWFYSFEYNESFVTLCADGEEEVIRF